MRLITVIFLLIQAAAFAQPTVFRLTLQVVDAETNRGIPRVGVELIGLGSGVTNSQGIAQIPIPAGTPQVQLQAPNGFQVLTPPGPILPVPGSEEVIVKFYIKAGDLELLREQVRELYGEQASLQNSLDSLKNVNSQLQNRLSAVVSNRDSLLNLNEIQVMSISKLDKKLETVTSEYDQVRLKIYGNISENYNQFLNAILNFHMQLKSYKLAFRNPGELEQFNAKIETLSEARDAMHEKSPGYLEIVRQYWDKDDAIELEMLYDQALIRTYETYVLPLNKTLIQELKASWSGQKMRFAAQKAAKKPTEKAIQGLKVEIGSLKIQADKVLKRLKSDLE